MTQLAVRILQARQDWSDEQRLATARIASHLADQIPADGFWLVGLGGAPGCGKSTLAKLVSALLKEHGSDSLVVSLDDYYLGKSQRKKLAATHALFRQRGVPGTHDWDLLIRHLDAIRAGDVANLALPVFDKMKDDRAPAETFTKVAGKPRVVLLEGWVIGAPPQEPGALARPVNRTEAELDPDGSWRKMVNDYLARYCSDLERRLDARWFMKAPGWSKAIDWRWQQEREGAGNGQAPLFLSRDEVAGFLAHFERIASHMISGCREWADIIIDTDDGHRLSIT